MNMTADIYVQSNKQNSSGTMERKWEYNRTVPCKVEPLSQRGASIRGDGENFGLGVDGYVESLQLKMKTFDYLSKRMRVSGIKSNDNTSVFQEIMRYDEKDTVFDVISCHPVLDPFGKVSHYSVNIRRAPIQNNDTTQS